VISPEVSKDAAQGVAATKEEVRRTPEVRRTATLIYPKRRLRAASRASGSCLGRFCCCAANHTVECCFRANRRQASETRDKEPNISW